MEKNPEWDLKINFKCNDCGHFLTKAGDLVSHTVEKHCDNKFYWCFLCKNYSSDKKPNLLQHFRDKHGFLTGLVTCPVCLSFHMLADEEIESHIIREHWTIRPVHCCNLCSYKCESSIAQHIEKSHRRKSCCVPGCSYNIKNPVPSELFQHMLVFHFPKIDVNYCCAYCDYMFGSEEAVMQHSKDKHFIELNSVEEEDINIEIICNLCENYKCEKKETFYKHMKAKHNLVTFICPFKPCSFSTDKFWKFSEHVSDEHLSEVTNKCPKCATCFPKEKSLQQHLDDKHFGDLRPFCSCSFFVGSIMDHLSDRHGVVMEVEMCRLCGVQVTYECLNHMKKNHGIDFPKGIEELYDDE